MTEHEYGRDWEGYESLPVPREKQCRKRDANWRRYCERPKGHTGNHRSGATQWGNKREAGA